MNGPELFDRWAPPDSVWSRWAKPVLFAERPAHFPPLSAAPETPAEAPPPPLPSFRLDRSMAVVVDLPGARSVQAGLDLAAEGYRPVPLFNGGHHPSALVDVQPVVLALEAGAEKIGGLRISPDAPPAFLLDAGRQPSKTPAAPGRYDNRWLVFPQDFPSANFLRSRQIVRVTLIQDPGSTQPADDLAHVLRRWQDAGIEILLAHPGEGSSPVSLQVAKPSAFRALSYRALAILGLRRNSAGGFGSVIPLATAGAGTGFG
jgi:hypothetical protein